MKPLAKPDLHSRVSSGSAVSAERTGVAPPRRLERGRSHILGPRERHGRKHNLVKDRSRRRGGAFTPAGAFDKPGWPTSAVGGHAVTPYEERRCEAWSECGRVEPARSAVT